MQPSEILRERSARTPCLPILFLDGNQIARFQWNLEEKCETHSQ